MTDSAWNFGPRYSPYRPHNAERERREEELHTDATLIMEAARRVTELQEYLDSLKPSSNQAIDVTETAQVMASDFHDYLEENVRDISPEAYRDWLARQSRKNPGVAAQADLGKKLMGDG